MPSAELFNYVAYLVLRPFAYGACFREPKEGTSLLPSSAVFKLVGGTERLCRMLILTLESLNKK